jgi:methylthioribose-1-phosphate isomerase
MSHNSVPNTQHPAQKWEVLHWEDNGLLLLDQTKLPGSIEYRCCRDYREVGEAIARLQVRGAPAIGVAAAFGYLLAAVNYEPVGQGLERHMEQAARELLDTRPTAVNLAWALDRMAEIFQKVKHEEIAQVRGALQIGALQLLDTQRDQDRRLADYGNQVVPERARILTYCNTGALATGGSGTALGVISCAHQSGKEIHVFVPETRPLLQGARLTAWELEQAGIPFTLVTDNMAGYLFSQGLVDLVIVGADRIVRNGDFANKIGTYGLAVLASYHQRSFYVAAPISTFDFKLGEGKEIPVEMRAPEEVRSIKGHPVSRPDAPVMNPSFDVTPHSLVTGYITECGVFDNVQELRGTVCV